MTIEEKIQAAIEYAQSLLNKCPSGYDTEGNDVLEDVAYTYADDEGEYDEIMCELYALV